jgi:hypothetical protein
MLTASFVANFVACAVAGQIAKLCGAKVIGIAGWVPIHSNIAANHTHTLLLALRSPPCSALSSLLCALLLALRSPPCSALTPLLCSPQEKCDFVRDELKFSACVSYRSPTFAADLQAACGGTRCNHAGGTVQGVTPCDKNPLVSGFL